MFVFVVTIYVIAPKYDLGDIKKGNKFQSESKSQSESKISWSLLGPESDQISNSALS